MLWHEYAKIFSKKTIPAILLFLALVNAFLFYTELRTADPFLFDNIGAYRQMEANYRAMPFDEAYQKFTDEKQKYELFGKIGFAAQLPENDPLQQELLEAQKQHPELFKEYTANGYAAKSEEIGRQIQLLQLLDRQFTHIKGYPAYISSMQEKADQMLSVSIFQKKGTFSYRNILKTPEDFAHLQEVPLALGLEDGLTAAVQFGATDLFLLFAVLLLALGLFQQEKENGLLLLSRANKKGHYELAAAKLLALVSLAAVLAAILYGTNFCIAGSLYGFGDLSRTLQSMPFFRDCSLLLSAGQFLFWFLCGKLGAVLFTALLLAFLFAFCRSAGPAYCIAAALFGASFAAYRLIGPLSTFNLLKYCNPVAFFDTYQALFSYSNVNLAGFPVSKTAVTLLCMLIFGAGFLIGASIAFVRCSTGRGSPFEKLAEKLRVRLAPLSSFPSIWLHEAHKLLLSNKAALFLAAACLFGWTQMQTEAPKYMQRDAIYKNYIADLAGPLTEEKARTVEQEKQRLDNLPERDLEFARQYDAGEIDYNRYQALMFQQELEKVKQEPFDKVYRQYQNLIELRETRGITGSFVDELSAAEIFQNRQRDLLCGIVFLLLLILSVSGVFPAEFKKGAIQVLRSTRRGGLRLYLCKVALSSTVAVLLAAAVYIPQLCNFARFYSPGDWNAPVQSISFMAGLAVPLSIRGFMAVQLVLLLFGALLLTFGVLAVSLLCRQQPLTILLCSIVYLTPLLLAYLGFPISPYATLQNPFTLLTSEFTAGYGLRNTLYFTLLALLGGVLFRLGHQIFTTNRIALVGQTRRSGK